ncbi:MAG: rhodanese-like domain-containing protein [Oligoflexia bacterium]|nr:rhodanese-like domain-containing protein [Oligoflexia bacterium]
MSNVTNITNIAFYRFVKIADPEALHVRLSSLCAELGLKGTILLASEGINGMLAGEDNNISAILTHFELDPRFKDMLIKRSYSDAQPFKKIVIKVKEEVISLGIPEVNPIEQTGKYIKPQELRECLEKGEDVILLDTRNAFEVEMGTFKNAINPQTTSFGKFPDFVKDKLGSIKDKKIVTFCTGGIRCEKATSLMLKAGFNEVYQLEGGILEYFAQTDGKYFDGSCFVFDERISLDHKLQPAKKKGKAHASPSIK